MVSAKHQVRRQLFIERGVQTEIICRVSFYFAAGFTYFSGLLLYSHWSANRHLTIGELIAHFLEEAIFWFPAVLIVIPLLVFDILKMTHRMVGPIGRFRAALNTLASGDPGTELQFRKDDHFQDLCKPFNEIRDMLIQGRALAGDSTATQQSTASPASVVKPATASDASLPLEASERVEESAAAPEPSAVTKEDDFDGALFPANIFGDEEEIDEAANQEASELQPLI